MSGGVVNADDSVDGLYECGICRMWFVVRADGSTAEAVFEDE